MATYHQSGRTIKGAAQAALLGLMLALGDVALAQSPATTAPLPLSSELRPERQSGEPASPTASTWGAYALETHKRVEKHLRANRDTFKYSFDLYIELWIDPVGRVMRTRVTGASGNRALDAMAGPDFPPGLVLLPPARDMPQPIKLKINADR